MRGSLLVIVLFWSFTRFPIYGVIVLIRTESGIMRFTDFYSFYFIFHTFGASHFLLRGKVIFRATPAFNISLPRAEARAAFVYVAHPCAPPFGPGLWLFGAAPAALVGKSRPTDLQEQIGTALAGHAVARYRKYRVKPLAPSTLAYGFPAMLIKSGAAQLASLKQCSLESGFYCASQQRTVAWVQ